MTTRPLSSTSSSRLLSVLLLSAVALAGCPGGMDGGDGGDVADHVAPPPDGLDGGGEPDVPPGTDGFDAPPDALCNGAVCNDGNACNGVETCVDNRCMPGTPPVCMDDGVGCTVEECDPAMGCVHRPDNSRCPSGQRCDAARMGCVTDTMMCDPLACQSDECTMRRCVDNRCEETPRCPADQDCCHGMCVPRGCDDGVACTIDACESTGCVHIPNHALCADGVTCSVDVCTATGCQHTADDSFCDDGNLCTDDRCDVGAGRCVYTDNRNPCNDGNSCTTGDTCFSGMCGGASVTCPVGFSCRATDGRCCRVDGTCL